MKIALIGAGVIGRLRAAAVHANESTALVAVADINALAADEVARSLGAKAFVDYRKLLEVPSLEAVIVSTPAPLHEEMCLAALEHGCHVLCEKPLAPNLESCQRIRRAAPGVAAPGIRKDLRKELRPVRCGSASAGA